jgi:SOS-response transcriptional repressor LexA
MTCITGIVKETFWMRVGERIRELREKKKMAGVQLATRAGVNQSYLSMLERGQAGFSEEGLEKIAKALGTDVAGLFGGGNVTPVALTDGAKVPIVDYTQALLASGPSAGVVNDAEFVLVDAEDINDLFALAVRGNSMLPDFSEGDLVIVRRSLPPRPGDFVVAADGTGEAKFRRYKVLKVDERGKIVFALVPMNDDFPTLNSDELPLAVRGVMVEHRRFRRR